MRVMKRKNKNAYKYGLASLLVQYTAYFGYRQVPSKKFYKVVGFALLVLLAVIHHV